jgi:hypothetical protein
MFFVYYYFTNTRLTFVLEHRIAGKGEWSVTYWLLKDKEGFVSKEAIRGMFDGSIFEKVEQMRKAKAQ